MPADDPAVNGNSSTGNSDDGTAAYTLPEILDGVGIDREYGSAANGVKFDRAVLPRGTTFDLRLTLEIPAGGGNGVRRQFAQPDDLKAVLGRLLEHLQTTGLRMGAGRTRGMGCVKLTHTKVEVEDWSSPEGLLDLLGRRCGIGSTSNEPASTRSVQDLVQSNFTLEPQRPPELKVIVHWRPVGPLMSKAPYDGMAADALPLLSRDGGRLTMVLSGQSIKGAFRSQAERIVRTLLGKCWNNWDSTSAQERHLLQVDEPLVREVFGAASRAKNKLNGEAWRRAAGCLHVDPCYAKNAAAPAEVWEAVHNADAPPDGGTIDGPTPLYEEFDRLTTAIDEQPSPTFEQGYHVAVDRWTGAAADHLLYSGIEPMAVEWEPLRLTLEFDSRRAPNELVQPATALVWLLLRDLAEDRIAIGYGGNRGYGSLAVSGIEFKTAGQGNDAIAWLNGMSLRPAEASDGGLTRESFDEFASGEHAEGFSQLQAAWTAAIDASFERGAKHE